MKKIIIDFDGKFDYTSNNGNKKTLEIVCQREISKFVWWKLCHRRNKYMFKRLRATHCGTMCLANDEEQDSDRSVFMVEAFGLGVWSTCHLATSYRFYINK